MENEYSSLISGNTYNIYTSDKRRLEVGEDQKVNIKPKFPKGFQHTTVTTELEGTKMVLNFTVDQELLKLFSSGTVNIDGVKETRSVTSLCDPIIVDNKNHTIEIRWSRDIIEILYANKIEKSEEPEYKKDYICKYYDHYLNPRSEERWNQLKGWLEEYIGTTIPVGYLPFLVIYPDNIEMDPETGEPSEMHYRKIEDAINEITLDGYKLDIKKDLIAIDTEGTFVLVDMTKYGTKEIHDIELSVNDVPVIVNGEVMLNSSIIFGIPDFLDITLKEITVKNGCPAIIFGFSLDTVNLHEGLEELPMICGGNLEQIELPRSLKKINGLVGNFSELNLPVGIEELTGGKFMGGIGIKSQNLTSIYIPNTVTVLGEGIFRDCTSLSEITIDCTGNARIPDLVEGNIFEDCPIKRVTILSNPDDELVVPIISGYVFGEDPELIIFVNPEKVDLYKEDGNWSIYSDYIYAQIAPTENSVNAEFNISDGAKALPKTQITIGNKINDVVPFSRIIVDNKYELDLTRDIKFYESNILYDFKEPGRHTVEYVLSNPNELGESMFSGCYEMTNIVIPDTVTVLGQYTLYNCSKLKNITIPNSVTSLENNALFGCYDLTSITIPSSVTYIGDHMFVTMSCPIVFLGTTPPTLGYSNYTFSKGAVVMVPEEAYNTYLTAWSEIDINIFPGDTISSITCTIRTDGNNTQIAHLDGEESPFTSILWYKDPTTKPGDISEFTTIKNGYLEFNFGVSGTQTLVYNFPGTKVFDGIFKGIEIGKILEISDTITEIGDFAFFDTSVYEVTIPATITSVENKAFPATTVHMLGTVPPQIKSDSFANEATIYVPEGYVSTYQTAYSSFSYTILEDQPKPEATGWTPYDPLDITGDEFVKAIDQGSLKDGYFYNVTTSFKEIEPGLYIATKEFGKYRPFDLNNSMLKSEFDYLAGKAQLGIDVVYYTTDTEQVFLALKPSEYKEIERESPEPKGTGWTPEDPIDVTGEEFLETLSGLKNGYFYNVTTSSGDKIIAGLYVITEKIGNGYKPFDLNNSMTGAEFDLLVKAEELVIDTVYYTTDREEVCLAEDTSKFQTIDRKSPEPGPGPEPPDPETLNWFYLKNESKNEEISLNTQITGIEYSTDKRVWSEYTPGTKLDFSDKLYLRSNKTTYKDLGTINASDTFSVGGNIMSLLYGLNFTGEETSFPSGSTYTFYYLFSNTSLLVSAENLELPAKSLVQDCYRAMFHSCTSLRNSPSLPATSLAKDCYYEMFSGCTSLIAAPELSSVLNLAGYGSCYFGMFYGCTSLVSAPQLPATTLGRYCYYGMFSGCTSLKVVPQQLPAMNLGEYCYNSMFSGCTSLISAPSLPATTLVRDCYSHMFANCTSLTTAPQLPATTLVQGCYENMFWGCTSLNEITTYANDISASNCLSNWLYDVAKSGTFYNYGEAEYTLGSYNGIPEGWTEEKPQPTEYSYTIEDDTNKVYPTDAWDNSFYVNVDYGPEGDMALWFGADKNTIIFENEANYSVSYKGTELCNGTFSYNDIESPADILSVKNWEAGSYDFVLDSPGKEYHRHYTITKSIK